MPLAICQGMSLASYVVLAMHRPAQAFARRVERELNTPACAERRLLARQAARDAESKPTRPPVPELDDESIVVLTSLLALPPTVHAADGALALDVLRGAVLDPAYQLK